MIVHPAVCRLTVIGTPVSKFLNWEPLAARGIAYLSWDSRLPPLRWVQQRRN